LVPNLELGHHALNAHGTYEDNLGKPALMAIGKKAWNRRLAIAITQMATVFNYRMLYLGGGHAKKVALDLPPNVKLVDNVAGLLGGIALWGK
jgi:polyphosphate glucokinase